jgi:hypothetical protein
MITRRVRHPLAVLCLSTLASLALILASVAAPTTSATLPPTGLTQALTLDSPQTAAPAAPNAPAAPVPQKVVVIRAIASDQVGQTPRYSLAQARTIFNTNLSTLWQNVSYSHISISATVTALVTMPRPRSDYLGGGGSSLGNLTLIMNDAVAAAGAIDYTGVKAVFVLFAEPVTSTFFFRGVENTKMLAIGSGGSLVAMPSAAFSENPTEGEPYVWGRWAHEMGHAFQAGGPAHPSNYNNEFELMDRLYPGQSGMFEKYISTGFPGWMPASKYYTLLVGSPTGQCGGTAFVAAEEVDPGSVVEYQAVKAELSAGLYYMVSVRKRLNGDELYPIPDQGVLIERVVVGADPWVTVQGKGGVRTTLWKDGDLFTSPENIFIAVASTVDPNVFRINVTCQNAGQPDAFLTPWLTPPLHTYETTDIWVDSLCNGYGTYQYGTYVPFGESTAVGNGNGDNPCANHDNRVYARIRNIGTQPANNVVVHFDATDPLGVGVAGASGWANIGNVTQADFPGLASIAVGGYTDVYIPWNPAVASAPGGDFDFHSCIRVRVDSVLAPSAELNTANNTVQENFDQFYSPPAPSGSGAAIDRVIHVINDSALVTKTFSLFWDSELPLPWDLKVNLGQTDLVLPPGGMQDVPVQIIPSGPRITGEVFHVNIAANSGRLLVNSLDATDTHFDAPLLGGVSFEVRIADPSTIKVAGTRGPNVQGGNTISVTGQFSPTKVVGQGKPIMIDLLDGQRHILKSRLITTDGLGNFMTLFQPQDFSGQPYFVSAGFMGELTLMGAYALNVITPSKLFLPLIRR